MSPLSAGQTIVGFGTSTPELVACVIAALRWQADAAIGKIVGSNIYNIGATALVHPRDVPTETAAFDIRVLLGKTALLILFLRTEWTPKRWESLVLLALYCV